MADLKSQSDARQLLKRARPAGSPPAARSHRSPSPTSIELAKARLADERIRYEACGEALWTLVRPGRAERSHRDLVLDALKQMPTIGERTANRLLALYGEELLGSMLGDNVYEFLYLMDDQGDLVFTDRQAARMERSLANFEFSFGEGGYQPTEFIKFYLPQGHFGLLIVDEGHEYKNEGSAQGQAMGVLARKCTKTLLLTGTLMGGYADDLFHLLWRLDPGAMLDDGFRPSESGRMGAAAMAFMREHGILKDVYKETASTSHRTAKGRQISHHVSKAPVLGPKGIMRFVLPSVVSYTFRRRIRQPKPPLPAVNEQHRLITERCLAHLRPRALRIDHLHQHVHGTTRSISSRNSRLRVFFVNRFRLLSKLLHSRYLYCRRTITLRGSARSYADAL